MEKILNYNFFQLIQKSIIILTFKQIEFINLILIKNTFMQNSLKIL